MSLPARAFIILAVFFAWPNCAFSQTPGLKNESNSSVTGKVTIKGKPAPGIVVGMRYSRADYFSQTYKATTNQDGIYRITNILNGTYVIAPIAPAMVNSDDNNPFGQTVVFTGGDSAEGINFDLVRGGVITGKVTDAEGHPMIEVAVSVWIADPTKQTSPYQMPNAQTDDRGVYRIFGIHPGRYKVMVSDNRRWSRNGPAIMPPTFYPDAPELDKATILEVDEGNEVANIDIKLGPAVQGFSVSGRVVDESGNPVPNFSINLSRIIILAAGSTGSEGTGAYPVSDHEGKFRIPNVRPGKYEVSVSSREDSDLQPQEPVRFDVVDADVTDLVVKTIRAARVSGVVTIEGPNKPPAQAVSRLSVWVYTKSETGSGFEWAGGTGVKADGTFVINGVRPGTLNFKIGGGDRSNGFSLTRIERDGIVQPNGIQLEARQHVNGLRLFVSYTSGTINGVMKILNGTLPPGARLSIQLARAEEPNMYFGAGEVDARGHFLIEGLAAGNYELVVAAYVPNRRPLITKQPVSVIDGSVTDVTVALDVTPSSNP